jgi:hypothetical protein
MHLAYHLLHCHMMPRAPAHPRLPTPEAGACYCIHSTPASNAHLLIHKALGAHKLVLEPHAALVKAEGQHHAVTIKGVTLVPLIGDLQQQQQAV